MDPITLGILAAVAILGVAALSWKIIDQWIFQPRRNASYATVLKVAMANGNHRVVSGVFDNAGTLVDGNGWESKSIDSTLRKKFENSSIFRVNVT